jgi:hypothetical protein
VDEEGHQSKCTAEEEEKFTKLLSPDSFVYVELFVQEAYLDYEDFERPLKMR